MVDDNQYMVWLETLDDTGNQQWVLDSVQPDLPSAKGQADTIASTNNSQARVEFTMSYGSTIIYNTSIQ